MKITGQVGDTSVTEFREAVARWRPRQAEIADVDGLRAALSNAAVKLTSDQKASLHRALAGTMPPPLEQATRAALGIPPGG